jgi:hypothetical protein
VNPEPIPAADITVDGTGLLCVTLLLRLRARIATVGPGTVVHVLATDPAGVRCAEYVQRRPPSGSATCDGRVRSGEVRGGPVQSAGWMTRGVLGGEVGERLMLGGVGGEGPAVFDGGPVGDVAADHGLVGEPAP